MLTGVVLIKNKAENISKCLDSLKFCDKTLVVSEEDHPLGGDFAAQRNWALSQVKSGWILFVDADEVISPDLASEILSAIEKTNFTGFLIHRIDTLWGTPLKHGDVGNVHLLRLGKGGKWVGKVHEIWQIPGNIGTLKNPLYHYPHPSLYEFLHKLNIYSSIRAQELHSQKIKSNLFQIITYPIAKFLYLGIWKLGFADGTTGFIHALTMSFYSFLVRGKLWLLWR